MLWISCPWCGARDESEFLNGGEAHVACPLAPMSAQWSDYLFFHDNPRGLLRERWVHVYGCRRWFNAVRDTASHRIVATYRNDEPVPETKS
ncbi:MAG: sarcosine oxidase subunit delta [Rhizomicrobium sp.]